MMITISSLTSYTDTDLQDLDVLLRTLAQGSACRLSQLQRALSSPDSHLYVLRDETRIVGCATLCVMPTVEMTIGAIEAVVVHPDYRGKQLGRLLVEHLLTEAQRLGVEQLHLTSNPRRIAANALYRSLGFQLKETNCYVLPLGQD